MDAFTMDFVTTTEINTTENLDTVSDAGSTHSESSDSSGSGRKKLKIKTKKKAPPSDDGSVSSSGSKKPRKKRTTKPNELEKYGFNPEMTWTFPRFKKYMEDSDRNLQNYTNVSISGLEVTAGFIMTFQKGVKEETILVLTCFDPTMMQSASFMSFINEFTNNTPKSSRLVILHTSAKAWGEKKVTQAVDILNTVKQSQSANETRHIELTSAPTLSSEKELTATEVLKNLKEPAPVPLKAMTLSKTGECPDISAEITSVFREYQKQREAIELQREALEAQMNMRLQQLLVGLGRSLA